MSSDDFRRRAAAVRDIPLERVLQWWGAVRDRLDKAKWHTEQGAVSITGAKFMNWQRDRGGGGAIDLVMHLADVEFPEALTWLEQHVGHVTVGEAIAPTSGKKPSGAEGVRRPLQLPVPNDRMLARVRQYLTRRRFLSSSFLEPLIESGKLYADSRGNAVFLLVAGTANRPVGAELRGTSPRVWRGMAPGTRRDLGYFWIGPKGSTKIVLCESAIDSISCFRIHPEGICISTSGVRANPSWLSGLIARGYQVYCGFDADPPGDTAAGQLMAIHSSVQRLRPPVQDWNDALAMRY